ncbi:MAG: SDR family NAD(P)-dependent oxidoreductase [Planctomycetota bacterium]
MPHSSSPVAIVTGGGTGIGKSVSLGLAKLGYRVAINFNRSELDAQATSMEVSALGGLATCIKADVGNQREVEWMVQQVMDQWGRIDFLVCNAGTTHFVDYSAIEELSDRVWNDIFQTNLMGSFYCARRCLPELKKTSGNIVFISSVAGITGMGSSIPYAVSKGALNTLTKALARTFGPEVRVNAVAPGPVLTRWLEGHEERIRDYLKQAPLGKACTADDVAAAVLYLGMQTNMTTGQVLVVDGGRTM